MEVKRLKTLEDLENTSEGQIVSVGNTGLMTLARENVFENAPMNMTGILVKERPKAATVIRMYSENEILCYTVNENSIGVGRIVKQGEKDYERYNKFITEALQKARRDVA